MIGAIATSFQMVYARTVVFGVPDPTIAMLTHASASDSRHSQEKKSTRPSTPPSYTKLITWITALSNSVELGHAV